MGLEKVLEHSFGLFKKDIRVVLPSVLNLIPSALFSIILLSAIASLEQWMNIQSLEKVLENTNLLWQIIKTVLFYVAISIPVFIFMVLISIFLVCVYSDITRQSYRRGKILLIQSFSVAKSRFVPLLWTYFLELLITFLALGALLVLGLFGGVVGIILAFLVGIIMIFFFLIFFYETPAVVVLENTSGLEAIRRSYQIGRHNFLSLLAVILIVGIILNTVVSGLSAVPYVGIILSNLAMLFLNTWNYMIPNVFYYEYEKKKEEI